MIVCLTLHRQQDPLRVLQYKTPALAMTASKAGMLLIHAGAFAPLKLHWFTKALL